MEELHSFSGQPFLEKEAAPNPQAVMNAAKNFLQGIGRRGRNADDAASANGKFVTKPTDSTVNPDDLRLFGREEVLGKATDKMKRESTGSFVTDGLLGITKRIFPGSKDGIENAVLKTKGALESVNTQGGAALAGTNPNSFRGKFWSAPVTREVGEAGGSKILREDRAPSLVAPVEKTVKFATPFLATMYAADKLYPSKGQDVNEATYEPNLQKQSLEEELESVFDKSLVEEMDKIASMQKIAELETTLSKYASQLEEAEMEKVAIEKKLEETIEQRNSFEKRASLAETNLMEKEAAFEELRLRTIAQKRSKVAVDLAEQMLECGLVKQAGLSTMVDELMECDERTIKMYQNLVKEAGKQEESLESLSILGEYKDNDKLATASKDLASHGLSRRGQSIGEAARDLNTK